MNIVRLFFAIVCIHFFVYTHSFLEFKMQLDFQNRVYHQECIEESNVWVSSLHLIAFTRTPVYVNMNQIWFCVYLTFKISGTGQRKWQILQYTKELFFVYLNMLFLDYSTPFKF